jgi:hypothetical protein
MDASEKMDSLNLLRCAELLWTSHLTLMSLYSLLLHSSTTGQLPPSVGPCRWMAPIASLCLIPAVLILEPTVVRCALPSAQYYTAACQH